MALHFAKRFSFLLCVLTFSLYYETFFGTVYALTGDQYTRINGHSNSFWGWGGEDSDCYNRFDFINDFSADETG